MTGFARRTRAACRSRARRGARSSTPRGCPSSAGRGGTGLTATTAPAASAAKGRASRRRSSASIGTAAPAGRRRPNRMTGSSSCAPRPASARRRPRRASWLTRTASCAAGPGRRTDQCILFPGGAQLFETTSDHCVRQRAPAQQCRAARLPCDDRINLETMAIRYSGRRCPSEVPIEQRVYSCEVE